MCGDETPNDRQGDKTSNDWGASCLIVCCVSALTIFSLALLIGTISVCISATNDSNRFGRCAEGPEASKYLPSRIFESKNGHLMRGSQCSIPIAVYLCLDDNVEMKEWLGKNAKCERYEDDARVAFRGCTSDERASKGEVPNRRWNCFYFRGSGTVGEKVTDGVDVPNGGWIVLAVVLTGATCLAFVFAGKWVLALVVPLSEYKQRAILGVYLLFVALILSAIVLVIEFGGVGKESQSDKPDLANITFLLLSSVLCVIGLVLGYVTIEQICEAGAGFSCRRCAKMPVRSSMPITPMPGSTPADLYMIHGVACLK